MAQKPYLAFSAPPRSSPRRVGLDTNTPIISSLLAEVKQLRGDLLHIANFERERVGHELHDDFTQNVAGIACLSRQLQGRLRDKDPVLASMAADIAKELHDVLERIRSVSHEYAPAHLLESELVECIRALGEKTEAQTGVQCITDLDDEIKIENVTVRLNLYRLCQEAIRNSIRHGKATRITIRLQFEAQTAIRLTIMDNGLGLHRDVPTSDGLGIRLMQYRCREIGTTLALRNMEDGGAIVECLFTPPESQAS